ncbi:unnamed protein product (macronuclear) [Paramecium tetraurelia]|uniref:Uncharacterized protein n=1 Tax=Paramecium tetraurelia TaxID=5888 RepID=A0DHF1_PARTE|nr:uncharacterized protein GSPATT00016855001 [Paramecium tetraurelia]CAK82468.1 unnamed protein product [Paramecium tetraurelia]|eukprot:XP_001449865.1 hypothetical protein (macronuclear) [Paramecium tetraurelia strain d4-2]
MDNIDARKYFKTGNRKSQQGCREGIVMRTESQEEDLKDLECQLQKKMCLNENECFFIEEILYTDPYEPEALLDENICINQDVTFNPQFYLNNENSIIG